MYALFVLIAFFFFVGICYPTPWHKKIKIDNRWKNAGVFVLACILSGIFAPDQPATDKTVIADKKTETKQQEPKKKVPKPQANPAEITMKEFSQI